MQASAGSTRRAGVPARRLRGLPLQRPGGAHAAGLARLARPRLALIGPPGVGKTHLASVWAAESGAATIVSEADVAALGERPALLDHDESSLDDEALFHLFNRAARSTNGLLIVSRTPPRQWPVRLPDLQSRLNALPTVEIAEPDDEPVARSAGPVVRPARHPRTRRPGAVPDPAHGALGGGGGKPGRPHRRGGRPVATPDRAAPGARDPGAGGPARSCSRSVRALTFLKVFGLGLGRFKLGRRPCGAAFKRPELAAGAPNTP